MVTECPAGRPSSESRPPMQTMSSARLIAGGAPDISRTTSTPSPSVTASLHHVGRGHLHEFGECSVFVQAVDARAVADVAVAGAAARTLAADHVHLGGDVVPDFEMAFVPALRARSELFDEAAELVSI